MAHKLLVLEGRKDYGERRPADGGEEGYRGDGLKRRDEERVLTLQPPAHRVNHSRIQKVVVHNHW